MIGEAVLLTFVMGHGSVSWMDNAVSPAGIVAGIRQDQSCSLTVPAIRLLDSIYDVVREEERQKERVGVILLDKWRD